MNYIFRIIRGGSFASYARLVRSGRRYDVNQDLRNRNVGFRLVRRKL
jgi:formylglycine-generating enzyme required for sulfatase activity